MLRSGAVTQLPQSAARVYHLSADSLILSDGASVSSWTDPISGTSAVQATGIRQPTYRASVYNGKPAVEFGGAAFMDCGRPTAAASAMDGTKRTVFVAFKTLGTTSNGMVINTSPAGGGNFMLVASGTTTGRFSKTMPHTSTGGVFSTVASVKSTEAGAFRTAINGGINYVDDADATTSGGQNIYIGGIQNSTFFTNAQIFEVIIWNTDLSAAELLQLEMWARTKYAQAYPWTAYNDFIVYSGNSQTQGSGALGTGSYPYQSAQALSRPYGTWTNIGQGGISMSTVDTMAARHADPIPALIGKKVKIAAFEYYNQRGNGAAACTTASRLFLTNRKAIQNMKTCFATSFSSTADPDATRTTYNSNFDADSTNCDAYVPMHTNTSIGISGAAATDANVTYFLDGIHMRSAGNAILATLMNTGLTAIP